MFFRREKTRVPSFSEWMEDLRKLGFTVQPESGGGMRVSKGVCAAQVKEKQGPGAEVGKAGILLGDEIGQLCDGGYQKFWLAPSGRRAPAAAEHLHALHNFEEDLKEGLGLTSLYNQSLGSVNELHLYDRVKDRDRGVAKRPWEH